RAFSAEEGRVTILGKYNVSLMESCGLATLLQEIHQIIGEKKFFEIFLKSTKISIELIYRSLGITPSIENLIKSLPFMDIYGWGKFTLIEQKEERNKMRWIVRVTNSPIVEYAKQHFGKNSNVCILYRSNLYIAFQLVFNKPVKVEETSCYTKGAPYCTFRIEVSKG
ncbi:MAG: V4R domain-containing protein, partial [Candidatus Aenigmatarchaeota archaeon]